MKNTTFSNKSKRNLLLVILLSIVTFNQSFIQANSKLTMSDDINKNRTNSVSILVEEFNSISSDMVSIATYPFSHPNEMLSFAGIMAGAIAIDIPATEFVQNTINPLFRDDVPDLKLFPHLAPTDEYILLGLGGLYASSLVFGNDHGQVTAIKATKAIIYSYFYSHMVLKTAFARNRPDPSLSTNEVEEGYTRNPLDFFNFHPIYYVPTTAGTAFPSFHFTMAFSVGRVISNMYDNPWLGYSIVSAAVLPHFEGHNHWFSDMLAGALIGTLIADIVTDDVNGLKSISTTANVFNRDFEFSVLNPAMPFGLTVKTAL
ncbi:hypothetical protein HOG98_07945 [bacterium]|nr:hypothetical protein [bacterium]